MSLFTCDNCHYTFETDFIPTSCPDCGKNTYNHKVGQRIVSAPCIRPATEGEVAQYEKVQQEIKSERKIETANNSFTEKLKMLGEPYFGNPLEDMDEDEDSAITPDDNDGADSPQDNSETNNEDVSFYPPDPYNLPIHEHNFSLMLLFYLRQFSAIPGVSDGKGHTAENQQFLTGNIRRKLDRMIRSPDVDEKIALYKEIVRTFRSAVNTERRALESKEPWSINYEAWKNATPALKTLYAFRQDEPVKQLLHDTPNLGNIKRVDTQWIAEKATPGFIQFLTELYNSIQP